ncbi:MAG: hypothetical protein MR873_07960 [Parabacteroides sp.]|nr:hypothetical protein [Parabacteroides sp.]
MKKSKILSIPIWHDAKRAKTTEIPLIKTGAGFGGSVRQPFTATGHDA